MSMARDGADTVSAATKSNERFAHPIDGHSGFVRTSVMGFRVCLLAVRGPRATSLGQTRLDCSERRRRRGMAAPA